MKKILSIAMCIIFALLPMFVFTSCGNKNVLYVLSSKPEYFKYYEWFNAEFEKKYNIKVEYTATNTSDFNTALSARITSKKLDVYTMSSEAMLKGNFSSMADIGDIKNFKDMDPYFKTLGQMYNPETDTTVQYSAPLDYNGMTVFYNKKMFADYGWTVPTETSQYSDFIALLQKIKSDAADSTVQIGKTYKIAAPILMGGKDQWPLFCLLQQLEPNILRRDYPTVYDDMKTADYKDLAGFKANYPKFAYNNDQWKEIFNKTKEISNYFQTTWAGQSYDTCPRYFSNGNGIAKSFYPIYIDGTWSYGEIMKQNPKFDVGTFLLPGTDNSKPMPNGKYNMTSRTGVAMSVFKDAPHMEMAKNYINMQLDSVYYKRYVDEQLLPSVMSNVTLENDVVAGMFDTTKYNIVQMNDAATIRQYPLPLAGDLADIINGANGSTIDSVLNTLQFQIDQEDVFKNWYKYKGVRNAK